MVVFVGRHKHDFGGIEEGERLMSDHAFEEKQRHDSDYADRQSDHARGSMKEIAVYAHTLNLLRAIAYRNEFARDGCEYSEGYASGLNLALCCLGWNVPTADAMAANAEFCF